MVRFSGGSDWQRNTHSDIGLKIRNSFIVDYCVVCTVFFADEYFVIFLICDFIQRGFRDEWLSPNRGCVLGNYLSLMAIVKLCVLQPHLYMPRIKT